MKGQMLKHLPADAILNIQSFLFGNSNSWRIKKNKKFVELQSLFKKNIDNLEIQYLQEVFIIRIKLLDQCWILTFFLIRKIRWDVGGWVQLFNQKWDLDF